jgi:hypothetical protein
MKLVPARIAVLPTAADAAMAAAAASVVSTPVVNPLARSRAFGTLAFHGMARLRVIPLFLQTV